MARAYAETFAGLRQTPDEVVATTFDLGISQSRRSGHRGLEAAANTIWCRSPAWHMSATSPPDGRITGLSKLARLVDVYAKRRRCRSG